MVRNPKIELWLPEYRSQGLSDDEAQEIVRECEQLLRAGDGRSREEIARTVLEQKVRCEGCERLVPDEPRPAADDVDGLLRDASFHGPQCPALVRRGRPASPRLSS
jgi:hypothetical protein